MLNFSCTTKKNEDEFKMCCCIFSLFAFLFLLRTLHKQQQQQQQHCPDFLPKNIRARSGLQVHQEPAEEVRRVHAARDRVRLPGQQLQSPAQVVQGRRGDI